MIMNSGIPLVRAAVMVPIFRAAGSVGVPVEKTALSAGLPIAVFQHPEIMVPQIPAQKFVAKAARLAGDNLFGVRMAQPVSFYELESVIPFITGCSNLYCVLKKFCASSKEQSTIALFTLAEHGELVWLSQVGTPLDDGCEHVEMFDVMGMIQLVQLAAGDQWRPPYIHLRQPYNPYIEKSSYFNPSQINYSRPYQAITIERELLSLPTPTIYDLLDSSPPSSAPTDIKHELLESIAPYIGEHPIDTNLISSISNMSLRTLQRKLMEVGSTYSDIVDQARFQKAESLLIKTDTRLLDISLSLGYQNASSFTRAFKRQAGVTPREYRKLYLVQNH